MVPEEEVRTLQNLRHMIYVLHIICIFQVPFTYLLFYCFSEFLPRVQRLRGRIFVEVPSPPPSPVVSINLLVLLLLPSPQEPFTEHVSARKRRWPCHAPASFDGRLAYGRRRQHG